MLVTNAPVILRPDKAEESKIKDPSPSAQDDVRDLAVSGDWPSGIFNSTMDYCLSTLD